MTLINSHSEKNLKQIASCVFCPVCFRIFSNETKNWIQHEHFDIDEYNVQWLSEHKEKIKNLHVYIQNIWMWKESSICVDCSFFFKKSKNEDELLNTKKVICKHQMTVFLEYLFSGGCTVKPCDNFMIHSIYSLLWNFPSNPLIIEKQSNLYYIVYSIQSYSNLFNLKIENFEDFICIIKWIWEGLQDIFIDLELAKNVRKYVKQHEGHDLWWKQKLPCSCRFCSGTFSTNEKQTLIIPYNIVLYTKLNTYETVKDYINKCIEYIERKKEIYSFITTFCSRCGKYSVISYQYFESVCSVLGIQCELINYNTREERYLKELEYYMNKIYEFKKKESMMKTIYSIDTDQVFKDEMHQH